MTKLLKSCAVFVLLATGLFALQPLVGVVDSASVLAAQPPSIDIESIIFEDNFSDPASGWRVDNALGFDWGYVEADDEYRVFLTSPGFLTWSDSPYSGSISNPVVVSADVRHHVTGSLAAVGALGLALFDGSGGIYFFLINPAQEIFGIWYRPSSGGLNVLVNWTSFSQINNINQDNELAVLVDSGETTFYINDQAVRDIQGLSITNAGVAAATFDTPNMNARFDNFEIARVAEEE